MKQLCERCNRESIEFYPSSDGQLCEECYLDSSDEEDNEEDTFTEI